jgi:hypothetical protein
MRFTATARRLGIVWATATVVLLVAYAATLAVGLASLESPRQSIGHPMFTVRDPDHLGNAGDGRANGGGARLGAGGR